MPAGEGLRFVALPMSETSPRLSFREKSGYACGDGAANLVFQTMLFYQLTFYTDAFGITATAAGTLFLVVRCWDAAFDPIMGIIADRTVSRWGKFRPWILGTALPFGLLFWLAFHTPHVGGSAKLVYAYATYIALMMVYSANNTPYSALNAVMTGDDLDRTSLASFRFVAAMTAALVVQSFTLPVVYGAATLSAGWSKAIGIYAVVAVVLLLITFLSARERILPARESTFREDIRDLSRNGPWYLMFAITLFIFITLAMRGGAQNYYFTYYADRASVCAFVRHWGFPLTTDPLHGFGGWLLNLLDLRLHPNGSNGAAILQWLFNILGNVVTLIGVLCSRPLSAWLGKKTVFLTGLAATAAAGALFALPGQRSIGEMFFLSLLWPACYGPTIPLLWVMIADVVDFSEWKTGRRATGLTYAAIVFALKAGLGVGGWLGALVLDQYHYVANAVQLPEAVQGIRLAASIFPAIPFAVAVIAVIFYPLGKTATAKISAELQARRQAAAAA